LGTDQVLAQRMFCCKNQREARRAILATNVGLLVPVLMLFVGTGVYAYFKHFPLSPEESELVMQRVDRILPIFVVKVLPTGITGLVIAAIFAAAISTLNGTLAALSQTTVMSIYMPLRRAMGRSVEADGAALAEADGHHAVTVSRWFIVFWGIVLSSAASVL